MDKDYRDLLEESIVRLEEKLAALDPTSDEYRKVNESLDRQYRLKIEETKYEADVKLRERHEENEEVMSEREYEAERAKRHSDMIFTAVKVGGEILLFAAGMVFNGVWAGRWMKFEKDGTVCSGWLREFLRNNTLAKKNKLG